MTPRLPPLNGPTRPMDRHDARNLEILTAIDEGRPLSQRALAERLGIALGLVNLYLRRLSRKGYVKITEFGSKPSARKRLRYLLTPKGMAEKSRLTYEHMAYALRLYQRARQTLRDAMSVLPGNGARRVALCGAGEAAELAYLTLRELGIEPVGVFDGEAGGMFLGFPVRPLAELAGAEVDVVVLATFAQTERHLAALAALGVPRERLVTLRRQPDAARPVR
jgi:DNA-binding MarR family transcriptional regulator